MNLELLRGYSLDPPHSLCFMLSINPAALGLHPEERFVAPLPFNLGLVQLLADHRDVFLTDLSLAAAFLGGVVGYILLVMLLYVAWNKRLAIRLAVVVLLALSLNDLLKMLLRNPRPFVAQGTYLKKWAVPAKSARELAMEFSTPSGHATGASSFYSYLYGIVRNRVVRVLAVAAILLIGVSRPYLGVHYFEDVLLGWALGLAIALVSLRYTEALAAAWNRLSYGLQVAIVAPAGLAFWLLAVLLNGHSASGQPYAYIAYGGFLTGAEDSELRSAKLLGPCQDSALSSLRRPGDRHLVHSRKGLRNGSGSFLAALEPARIHPLRRRGLRQLLPGALALHQNRLGEKCPQRSKMMGANLLIRILEQNQSNRAH
jgi:membrane-associated phospholipid phosphatase